MSKRGRRAIEKRKKRLQRARGTARAAEGVEFRARLGMGRYWVSLSVLLTVMRRTPVLSLRLLSVSLVTTGITLSIIDTILPASRPATSAETLRAQVIIVAIAAITIADFLRVTWIHGFSFARFFREQYFAFVLAGALAAWLTYDQLDRRSLGIEAADPWIRFGATAVVFLVAVSSGLVSVAVTSYLKAGPETYVMYAARALREGRGKPWRWWKPRAYAAVLHGKAAAVRQLRQVSTPSTLKAANLKVFDVLAKEVAWAESDNQRADIAKRLEELGGQPLDSPARMQKMLSMAMARTALPDEEIQAISYGPLAKDSEAEQWMRELNREGTVYFLAALAGVLGSLALRLLGVL